MFDSKISKISISRSQWGQTSSINPSNAPGFVPIPCPTHPQYSITNICKTPNCIEPLCPECIANHVQLHQQTKKPAQIDNIVNTRIKCIEQLAQMKYEASKQYSQSIENSQGNIDKYVESHQNRLDTAFKKIQHLVEQTFSKLYEVMDVIAINYQTEKQKKEKEALIKMSPMLQFIQKVEEYKQELQSDEYVPALIELLNEPPRKPKVQTLSKIDNMGGVEVNQKYLNDIRSAIDKFVKINCNLPEKLLPSGSRKSNNLKFSRLDQSREKSRKMRNSSLNDSRSSRSKSKIFQQKQSFINYLQPRNQSRQILSSSSKTLRCQLKNPLELQILKNGYFSSLKEKKLITFKEGQRYYLSANLEYIEAGFTKNNLSINFDIPFDHQTIIMPNGDVFMIGGQFEHQYQRIISEKVFQLSEQQHMTAMQPMKQPRASFGACYHEGSIYVFGGITNNEKRYQTVKATSNCQIYNLTEMRWKPIAPLSESVYNFIVCPLSKDKIIKLGGFLQPNNFLNTIDIYHTTQNFWTRLQMTQKITLPINAGKVQISNNSLLIFGGCDPNTKCKLSSAFILSESENLYKINPTKQLYNEASFESAYIFKNEIVAIQEGQPGRNKVIMSYRYGQWKFISC